MTRNRNVQVAGRLGYRAAIEAFYAEHPTATQEQARRATGAPRATVRRVFEALVAAGRLPREPGTRGRIAAAGNAS